MRRRASVYVQKTSAAQMATRNRTSSLTARFSPSFEIPKMASGVMKGSSLVMTSREKAQFRFRVLEEDPAQQVADAEEHEDPDRHEDGHDPDHLEKTWRVVHGATGAIPGLRRLLSPGRRSGRSTPSRPPRRPARPARGPARPP